MNNLQKYLSTCLLATAALLYGPAQGLAVPILGSAESFAVLGGSAVTNTGSTTLNGNLGVYPGSAITSTGITFKGASTNHGNDATSQQAQLDETNAYNVLKGQPFTSDLTGSDLGTFGTSFIPSLSPGVYKFSTTAQLNGTLTLDFGTTPDALFIFQIGTALTTASGSVVDVLHGNSNSGVYWEVGSSATLGTTTSFAGNILALDSITLNTNATILCGRAFAQVGAVTMDTNTISNNCSTFDNGTDRSDFGSAGFSGGATGVIPEPETYAMLMAGLGVLGFATRRRKLKAAAA